MKQLTDFIFVQNIIPKELCETAISKFENDPGWQQHFWYGGESKDKNKELDILFTDAIPEIMEMFSPFVEQGLTLYQKDFLKLQYPLVNSWGQIRLNKYKTGKQMSSHFDLIKRNSDDGIPTLSFLGVLNDNFKGGEFIIFEDMEIKLKQGDILIFPSTFLYPHKVNEITEGTRYSFVTWIY